jgi:hypothetical protein
MIEYMTPPVVANPEGIDVRLTHEQLWQALMWKGEFAHLFVAPISDCRVLQRFDDGFLREVVVQLPGREEERIQERLFLEPLRQITFLRLNGEVYGQIVNIIDVDDDGELTLRFGFTFALQGAQPGGPEEREYERKFAEGYIAAVNDTLDAARRFVRTGEDPTQTLTGADVG